MSDYEKNKRILSQQKEHVIEQFMDELKTDCEHWYYFCSGQSRSQKTLLEYRAGIKFARLAYQNRAAREFGDSAFAKVEQCIEALLQSAILQTEYLFKSYIKDRNLP